MVAHNTLKLQQSQDGVSRPGYWKLAPERAVTLDPTEAGVLRVAQGQVWATLDGPHQGPANDWGDLVLHSGEQLKLMPGQHVVVEPFGDAVNEPAYFSWEPSTALSKGLPTDESGWRDALAQPTVKPDDEILATVRRVGRLLSKLVGFVKYLVAGKGRVLSPLESNQP